MTEIISFVLENDLLIEGLLTLASASIPALIPLAHLFRQRKEVVKLLHGMDQPNLEILVLAQNLTSQGTVKLLAKELRKLENLK